MFFCYYFEINYICAQLFYLHTDIMEATALITGNIRIATHSILPINAFHLQLERTHGKKWHAKKNTLPLKKGYKVQLVCS